MFGVWTIAFSMAVRAWADDWPFFRGPQYNGVSSETGWSTEWPESGPIVAWQTNVGVGASSVVVSGDRVVTMGNRDDRDTVWCVAASTGHVAWKYEYQCELNPRQFEGGPASTPTIADGRVYTLAWDGQLHCLDLASGRLLWRKHLVRDFRGRYSNWKYAGSPLVIDGVVILDTGADGDSTVALDAATGEKIWGSGSDLAGYSTPIPFRDGSRRGVLVFKARAMVALDRATGEELWRIPWKTFYDCNASSPTVTGDKLFISTGYGGRLARGAWFQLTGKEPRQLWVNQDIETRMNSAVLCDGHVYCISEIRGGRLMCAALESGQAVWEEASFARFGTLMIADGKLIVLDEPGTLVIAAADPRGYREMARAKVLDSRSWVMPVLANGRIYVRSNKGQLVCLDVRN